MDKAKKGPFYGWAIVVACFLVMATFFTLMLSLLSLYVVPMTEGLGINRTAFSLFSTIMSVLGMVVSPFAGPFCARKNIRVVMTVSLLICTVCYFCMSFVSLAGVPLMYVIAVVAGVFANFCTTVPVAILITRWFVKNRALAMSITFAGSSVGAMILSPIVTGIINSMGWEWGWRILGIFMTVIIVPLVFILVRGKPEDKGLTALGAEEAAAAAGTGAAPKITGITFGKAKSTATFWIFCIGIFATLLTLGTMYHMAAYATPYLGAGVALFVSLYSLISILGKIVMGIVFDRAGLVAGTLLGTVCMALCCVLLIVAGGIGSFAGFVPVTIFYGFGMSVGTIFPSTLTSRLFGVKHYGDIFGLVNAFASLSIAVANILYAALFDATGTYTMSWIVGIGAAVLGTILLLAAIGGAKKNKYAEYDGE